MRRRDLILMLGGAVVAWPLAARGQSSAMPVIGFLDSGSAAVNAHLVAAFRQGLKEAGYVEHETVAIEYRWAEGDYDRLPGLVADLVRRRVSVIVATGGDPSAQAAKPSAATIPVVFDSGTNPVELGLVASLNRPGGNMTGVNQMIDELVTKQVGLLHELVPHARLIAMLENASHPKADLIARKAQTAAAELGCNLEVLTADKEQDIDAAFTTLNRHRVGALFVGPDPFLASRHDRIIALAARDAVPALFVRREFAAAGGLMSYGTSLPDAYRQIGVYAGRVLKGEKPADLPVVQSTRFDLVINLKTARALGLTIPPALLVKATEVIE